jgi:AcrR family transcriptional regulator
VSIEDVAATLGIADTSVCNHVPSKSGILSGTTATAQDSRTGEAPTPDAQRKLVIGAIGPGAPPAPSVNEIRNRVADGLLAGFIRG